MSRIAVTFVLCSSFLPQLASAQDEQSPVEMFREGGRLIQLEEFGEAAKIFRKVVKADEDNAQAWLMLGYALHMDGKLDEALKMHEKTSTFSQTKGIGFYNMGCAYALKGNKDKAFSCLNQAVKARFPQIGQYATDDDLASLRKDIRYKRLEKRIDGEEVTDDFPAKGMIGRWVMVSRTKSGKKDDSVSGFADVGDKSYVLKQGDEKEGPIPYIVDVSKLVPTITIAGQMKGILKMAGDQLTICLNENSEAAPTDFKSTEDNNYTVMVVRRAVTSARLKGTWNYVSGMRAGEKVAKERLVGPVSVTDETFTLPAGPSDKFVMKYSMDSNAKMDLIDLNIQSGPVPEGKAVGIVRMEGDTMTFCYDPTGMKRPTEFKTTKDNGYFMFKLKRVAAKK